MGDKLTINLDSTVLSKAGCVLAMKRKIIDGYVEPLVSANIVYGVAIHKFIDTMYQTRGDYAPSIIAAKEAFNIPKFDKARQGHLSDERHMLSVAFTVWESWVKKDNTFKVYELDDKPLSEYTFSIKIYEDDWIIVNLCGTIDIVGQVVGGVPAVKDWKTTSTHDAQIYFRGYEMNRQLRIYALALRLMNRYYPNSFLGTIGGSSKIGGIIDGIFVKPAPNDTKIARSEVFLYGDTELNQMENLILVYCAKLSYHIQHNLFPQEGLLNGSCQGKWGECMFWNVCKVKPEVAEVLLKRDFKVKLFNPLTYNEVEAA